MNQEIVELINTAALSAAHEMGCELLDMSCFVSKWATFEEQPDEQPLAA